MNNESISKKSDVIDALLRENSENSAVVAVRQYHGETLRISVRSGKRSCVRREHVLTASHESVLSAADVAAMMTRFVD